MQGVDDRMQPACRLHASVVCQRLYTHQQTDISSHAVNTCDVCLTLQAVMPKYHVMLPMEVVVMLSIHVHPVCGFCSARARARQTTQQTSVGIGCILHFVQAMRPNIINNNNDNDDDVDVCSC